MIEESYVTLETAKLLEEAGFDEVCSWAYYTMNADRCLMHERNSKLCNGHYSCPTQALAARWLREVYNLHVTADPFGDFSLDADGEIVDKFTYWGYIILNAITGDMAEDNNERFDNYEEAFEAGLQEAIKMIKK